MKDILNMGSGSINIALAIVTYFVVEVIKLTFLPKIKNGTKYIPVFAGGIGLIISILIFIFDPDYLGLGKNILSYITSGIVSGLAATGGYELKNRLIGLNKSTPTIPALYEEESGAVEQSEDPFMEAAERPEE